LAGIQIGQLLVQQGVLTEKQVQHIVSVQRVSHRPFGDLAERLYGVSPEAIEDAWVQQYVQMAGVVELCEMKIQTDCLKCINRRQAWQFQILPTHRDDQHLQVATDAEHLIRAVNFSTRRLDEPVYFVIAQRAQLREFLMKHYPVPEHMAAFAENM
jgi:Type II secretion system (T2SS), protein E, N-terminal domain